MLRGRMVDYCAQNEAEKQHDQPNDPVDGGVVAEGARDFLRKPSGTSDA